MIAFDTNVLLRYLLRDDQVQAAKVKALVDGFADDERVYISDIVLCETVWVLQSVYGLERGRIAGVLRQLAATRQLAFDSSDRLLRATQAFTDGPGDFADYLIREHARKAGCLSVLTFDKAVLSEEMFASP